MTQTCLIINRNYVNDDSTDTDVTERILLPSIGNLPNFSTHQTNSSNKLLNKSKKIATPLVQSKQSRYICSLRILDYDILSELDK